MVDADEVDTLARRADELWWRGQVDDHLHVVEALVAGRLAQGRPGEAAMAALAAAVTSFLRGDRLRGSGWVARTRRLVQDLPEGPVHGYVRHVVEVEAGLGGEHLDGVATAARDVRRLGREHGDANLVALGLVGEGRARLRAGEVAPGLMRLDEAMVAVLGHDLDPAWAGNVYCHLMAACHEVADVRRAAEWTEATERWVSQLPAAALFTGICRVHRSQLLQLTGRWDRAEAEAVTVCREFVGLSIDTVAEDEYQVGEMRRLRGDLDSANAAFQRARERGRDPQPGLALLRLAQGRLDVAAAGIDAAVRGAPDRLTRARLRTAQVEVALAADDLATARAACADLEDAADAYGTSGLEAAALHWRGAVLLAAGRAEEALPALRAACRRWRGVHARFDAARACVLLARAYGALGDHDAAASELEAARRTFSELGASVDAGAVARLASAVTPERAPLPGGLTRREAEVLVLVATGRTNRQVAEALTLSQKTIARHLSNIFVKLDVSTRTEAAAFAHAQGLVAAATPGDGGHG